MAKRLGWGLPEARGADEREEEEENFSHITCGTQRESVSESRSDAATGMWLKRCSGLLRLHAALLSPAGEFLPRLENSALLQHQIFSSPDLLFANRCGYVVEALQWSFTARVLHAALLSC